MADPDTLWHESSLAIFNTLPVFAKAALTTSILVNGGAAVALLAFLGNLISKTPRSWVDPLFIWSLGVFAAGVFFGAAATGFAFLAQYKFYRMFAAASASGSQPRPWNALQIVTFVLVGLTYFGFAAGATMVCLAFAG